MIEKLVSVLTPVYNGEAYIARLLDSVLCQTYPSIEMILVDDGSADATVKTAEKYISKFIEKGYTLEIISALHKNASAAINAGLCKVKGEYLIWPDADDELHPDSVDVRVRFLEAHPEYACVRSVMDYISDETGEMIVSWESLGDLAKENLFWDVLEGRTYVCCGCYMLKTEKFFQIYPSKRIPEYDVGQNFQMLLPFLFRHKCPTIPEKLYRVHVRSDSHSRRKLPEAEEEMKVKQFEQLVNDILKICGTEKNSQAVYRCKCWNIRRKRDLALKYHHYMQWIMYRFVLKILGRFYRSEP